MKSLTFLAVTVVLVVGVLSPVSPVSTSNVTPIRAQIANARGRSLHPRTWFNQAATRARRRRFDRLVPLLMTLPRPLRILDVGGEMGFWNSVDYAQLGDIRVTLLNGFPQESLPPNFSSCTGDARSMAEYKAGDFDVVMSNSTIGHVGGLRDQDQMAREIARIGKRYVVQTPNRYFPLDWQTLVPLFHFLPLSVRARLLQWFPISPFGRLKSYYAAALWSESVRNLSLGELRGMFPGATVARERVLGFTKSFVVLKGFEMNRT